MRSHLDYPSRQNVSDPKPEEGWRRKSGAAETLISHAGFRYEDIVRHVRIQLHIIGYPHSLATAVRALRLYKPYVSRQNEHKARTAD